MLSQCGFHGEPIGNDMRRVREDHELDLNVCDGEALFIDDSGWNFKSGTEYCVDLRGLGSSGEAHH
jgi:hypothetical protein